jgi:hypothetical protein
MTSRKLLAWLRAALSRLRPNRALDITRDQADIRRSLRTRLPARLLKDIGADDG